MKQRHPHNIQTRLSPEHMAFVLSLADRPADGIRRAIDLARLSVEASRSPDPAAQLAYYLDRAAAMLAAMRSAQQPQPLYKEGAQVSQPAQPAADGFEGWDE